MVHKKVFQIEVYTQEEAIALGLIQKSNTLTYVIILVVLIVVWFIYRSWRKRKKRAGRV